MARAWSGYVDSLLGGVISNATISTVGELHEQLLGRYPDFLAFAVCICYACVLGKDNGPFCTDCGSVGPEITKFRSVKVPE